MRMNGVCFSYASDIHLGFYPPSKLPDFQWSPESDVLLLAGDIMDGLKKRNIDWVLSTCEGRQGLLALGNHEVYGSRRDKVFRELTAAFSGTHVKLLLNESMVINGVRIAGTDLWTDYALHGDAATAARAAEQTMTDYRRITVKEDRALGARFRRLRAADTQRWHGEARRFIQETLDTSEEPVVLMTHHAPSLASVPKCYRDDVLSAAYASNLEPIFEHALRPPVVNVHGHVHNQVRYRMACGTWVLANPHGYYEIEDQSGFHAQSTFSVYHDGSVKLGH